jgi:septal ring-binding cell division protein DamX
MAEAQEWRAQFAALNKSRIAAVKTPDKGVKYVVISGPFATQKEAESFAARPGVPADPWLRPLKSLQRALVSSSR